MNAESKRSRFAMCRTVACLVSIAASLVCVLAHAADDGWQPSPPVPDKYDWIQLTSDEWLKGKILGMYEENLEFESEEFELLTLDWEDIKLLRSARILEVRLASGVTAVGKLLIDTDAVQVIGQEDQQFERSQLLTIAAGEAKESSHWSARITLGANFRRGNSEVLETNTSAKIQRRTTVNRFIFDYRGAFNVTDDVDTTDNQRASVEWDRFIRKRFYTKPVFFEFLRDPFLNIAHQETVGVGVGYHIVDTSKTEWGVSGGPAYQQKQFDSVEEGGSGSEGTLALVAGTTVEMELSKSVDFNLQHRMQFTNEAAGKYNHNMVVGIDVDLTNRLDLDVSFVWDRIQNPRAEQDTSVPEQDDFRLVVGLGLTF